MKAAKSGYKGLVLAVHPTTRGFGWVLFEGPLAPIDWGIASSGRASNAKLIARLERLLNRYEPAVLVLEEFEGRLGRVDRIQRLCRSMIHMAACRGMDTPVFRRNAIRAVFATLGASSRYEIAQVISRHLDSLNHLKPKRRRVWENPDPRQSIFDAAAVALTYFAVATKS